MTVITKPLTDKKPDKVPLVLPVNAAEADFEKGGVPLGAGGQRLNERYHYILRNRANSRASSATLLCLLVTALLVMTAGLFGGLYVYKQVARNRVSKWRGWCNVPYYTDTPYNAGRLGAANSELLNDPLLTFPSEEKKIDADGLSNWDSSSDLSDSDDVDLFYPSSSKTAADFFREEFELDLDEERYTKVEVPDFKNGRLGRFIHEFDSNKTAIVDQTGKRCFILPLDRERILPPKSMYDMIEKMWKGYYSVNTKRIRENMRVLLPALDDLSDLGEYIQQECNDKTTYKLEKATDRIYKRSISDKLPFTEFAGKMRIDYDIVNLDQIEHLENLKSR